MAHLRTNSLAASLLVLLVCGAAQAQSIVESSKNPADPSKAIAGRAAMTARPLQPPGLPGARSSDVAPPSDTVNLLGPNDALFDAVNRGDVAAARDALSRGADIEARNILGLTALEEAIDLGRNDLTFLLLSLRNAAPGARSARVAQKATTVEAPRPVAKPAPAPVTAARVAVAKQPTSAAVVHYSNDPGTPAPAAGFLGFGGTSQ